MQLTWQLPVQPEQRSMEDFSHRTQLRAALWAGFGSGEDEVEKELSAFRSEAEEIFRKIIAKR
jgi:hypothetical protein